MVLADGSTDDTIGGTTAAARNVISGNGEGAGGVPGVGIGVDLDPSSTTSGSVVEGNYIGTDKTGTAAMENASDGVEFGAGARATPLAARRRRRQRHLGQHRSTASRSTGSGTTGNLVAGNLIGTDYTGTAALANGINGVEIDTSASGNTIGGTTAAARNIISANVHAGVEIDDANDNLVEGNLIGTDVTGTVALGNNSERARIRRRRPCLDGASGNTIGGLTATPGTGAGNLISGNTFAGVSIG